jgi:hypothetical protein
MRPLLHRLGPSLAGTCLVAALGCQSKTSVHSDDETAPATSASAAGFDMHPVASAMLDVALNPGKEKPYSGPIGGVRGVIHTSGDPAPDLPEILAKIPAGKCDDARAFYGKLFREGPGRELGDVLVAVTEYKGYLPPRAEVKQILARGCAYETRTIALVLGQRLDVKNRSPETFIPKLIGASQAALVVAMPGGEPVHLFPPRPGQYLLQDQTHLFALADVFVLKYPTTAVTGLDGTYEIKDIPVGDVLVSAYLPSTGERVTSRVQIVAGETAKIDLTIPFDAAKHAPQPAGSAH